jgi:hypothetical protein
MGETSPARESPNPLLPDAREQSLEGRWLRKPAPKGASNAVADEVISQ